MKAARSHPCRSPRVASALQYCPRGSCASPLLTLQSVLLNVQVTALLHPLHCALTLFSQSYPVDTFRSDSLFPVCSHLSPLLHPLMHVLASAWDPAGCLQPRLLSRPLRLAQVLPFIAHCLTRSLWERFPGNLARALPRPRSPSECTHTFMWRCSCLFFRKAFVKLLAQNLGCHRASLSGG